MNPAPNVMQTTSKLAKAAAINRLACYGPYPFQKRFHAAKDVEGRPAMQRLLMAGNQVGKTVGGANETAMHATGQYPGWWDGFLLPRPLKIWCGGVNNDKVRDICQAKLFGTPGDPSDFGKGAIPKASIIKTTRKPGIPDAFDSALVRHDAGHNVIIGFKSYEAGKKDWQGEGVDVIWLDEEPDEEIFSQALARVIATRGIIYMTFTPEKGMTQTVHRFMHQIKPGQALYMAGWKDAPHLTEEAKEQLRAVMLPHERQMREEGLPVLGSGMVYPVDEAKITVEAFPIPEHWPRINGLDIGWDHPTACSWIAWDREADKVYVYDVYRQSQEVPAIHAEAIKARGQWIPVAWPHDGMVKDKGSGRQLAAQYRDLGVNMLGSHFTNPPDGSGKDNFAVEPGILEILTRMRSGRFFVFSHLAEWFEEFRGYYRKDGLIVKINDDLMSGTRYGVQSLRYATVQVEPHELPTQARGSLADYDPYAG